MLPDYARLQYYISAIINNNLLKIVIEISRTNHAVLLNFYNRLVEINIPLSKTIECVAGKSILKAAKKTNKEWWVMKLYLRKSKYNNIFGTQAKVNLLD